MGRLGLEFGHGLGGMFRGHGADVQEVPPVPNLESGGRSAWVERLNAVLRGL